MSFEITFELLNSSARCGLLNGYIKTPNFFTSTRKGAVPHFTSDILAKLNIDIVSIPINDVYF